MRHTASLHQHALAFDPCAALPCATVKVDAKAVKALRDQTGAGMMDCKKALVEAEGNAEVAVEALRAKGLAAVDKKAGRSASEGIIETYIHTGTLLSSNRLTRAVRLTDPTAPCGVSCVRLTDPCVAQARSWV